MHLSLQVLLVGLDLVLVCIRGGGAVQVGLQSRSHQGLHSLEPGSNRGNCHKKAAGWFHSSRDSVHKWPVSSEETEAKCSLKLVVTLGLRPEHGSELLFILLEQAWVVEHLLEELLMEVKLVEYLKLSPGQSGLHSVASSRIVE